MMLAAGRIDGAVRNVPAGMIVIDPDWLVHGRLLPQVLQNAVAK
jgi:hypothetical protein